MTPDLAPLFALVRCHSTPGDETEVRDWLAADWRRAGWTVTAHDQYALTAVSPGHTTGLPTVLITAHLDSPGYTVEQVKDGRLTCVKLGSPQFAGAETPAVLKTGSRKVDVILRQEKVDDDHDDGRAVFTADYRGRVRHGDRLCFRAEPRVVCGRQVLAPFLDNRIGCFLLSRLAHDPRLRRRLPVNLVLGATGSEEMGGFGAAVMARAVAPDLAICLDATYVAEEQNVLLGRGPVLTLSDASVLLSAARRDAVRGWFRCRRLPLQTEVYNYSGTDARAFPHQGLPCPVLALLVATKGNHSPVEQAAIADIEALFRALRLAVADPEFLPGLRG